MNCTMMAEEDCTGELSKSMSGGVNITGTYGRKKLQDMFEKASVLMWLKHVSWS